MKQFDAYGIRAKNPALTSTEKSGRYTLQADGVKKAFFDIVRKLDLQPHDRLLDVGCGVGDLTIPLSMVCNHTTVVDHPNVIKALKERVRLESVTFLEGNFLEIDTEGSFDKILSYGVVVCLDDKETVIRFIEKGLRALAPGGRMLIGDLTNRDKKERFLRSEAGIRFSQEWQAKQSASQAKNSNEVDLIADKCFASEMDDEFMAELFSHFRRMGCEAFILPQPSDLAFGHTREDLLIIKPV